MMSMSSSISFGFIGLPNDAPAIISNTSTFSHLRFMEGPPAGKLKSQIGSALSTTRPARVTVLYALK
jgi:hypothetical protein